jgi:hypothetical protein
VDDPTNNPAFLNHMVYQSEAFKIYQRRLTLDTLLFVFDRNYQELRGFLTDAVKPEHIDLLWKQREATVILREVIRLVHNYVASAKMLVDNTRPLIQDWYKNTSFLAEYNAEVRSRFLNNSLSLFIEDLRNYILHYSLPITTATIKVTVDQITGNQTEIAAITINKPALLRWKKWSKGKKFLDTAEDEIVVLDIIERYYHQVTEFHEWMHKAFDTFHAAEFAWLKEMELRINDLRTKQTSAIRITLPERPQEHPDTNNTSDAG